MRTRFGNRLGGKLTVAIAIIGLWMAGSLSAKAATNSLTLSPLFQQQVTVSGSPFVYPGFQVYVERDSYGESRGVYEYRLPALPTGSTISAASLNYYVSQYAGGPGSASEVSFHGYAGDGLFAPNDALVPFHQVASSGPISSGFAHSSTLDANYLLSRHTNGTSYLGIMAYDEIPFYSTGLSLSSPVKATYTVVSPNVGTLSTTPLVDGELDLVNGGTYSVLAGNTSINVQEIGFASIDRRGALEFDLRGLPAGATITSASIRFNVNVLTSGGAGSPSMPRIFGYQGDGTITAADATGASVLLGTGAATDLGTNTIALDAAAIQALLSNSSTLGLLVRGDTAFHQFGFSTLASSQVAGVPASLSIAYSVPEPSLAFVILIPAFILRGSKRRTVDTV